MQTPDKLTSNMTKVRLVKDEWYPFFSIVEGRGGDVVVELSTLELEQYEFALKTIRDAQSMLEDKYNSGEKLNTIQWGRDE